MSVERGRLGWAREHRTVRFMIAATLVAASLVPATSAMATTKTVSKDVTIPAAPSASFSGSTGGDGFNAAVTAGRVYSVFHHRAVFKVACLNQADGSECGGSWPYIYSGVSAPMWSYAFISPDGSRLYAYAVKNGALGGISGGVVCITLPTPDSCGYTSLTTVAGDDVGINWDPGEAGGDLLSLDFGSSARVGNRIYTAFADATRTGLTCFDVSVGAQCAGAPYLLTELGTGWQQDTYLQGPRSLGYGGRVYSIFHDKTRATDKTVLTCWDPATSRKCGDLNSWPVTLLSPWGLVPALTTTGAISAVCSLEGEFKACFDAVKGTSVPVPGSFVAYGPGYTDSGAFYGQAKILGTRIIFLSSTGVPSPRMSCIDFSTSGGQSCGHFIPANAELTYAIDLDPDRPGCLWFNSDKGSGQIQNFDSFTMQAGCSAQNRVTRPQLVTDIGSCPVYEWSSVQVLTPSTWDSAKVSVRSANGGSALPGGTDLALSTSAATSLSGVNFIGETSPNFLFDINGDLSAGITARFTWVTANLDKCSTTRATALVSYTGTQGVISAGTALQLSATVSPAQCLGPVVYSLDADPRSGAEVGYSLAGTSVSTSGWLAGAYGITALYPTDPSCDQGSDIASVTITVPTDGSGLSSSGGGWYRSGSKVTFGHVLNVSAKTDRKTNVTTTTYRGQLLWQNSEWRLKAPIYAVTLTTDSGTTGTPASVTIPCPVGVGSVTPNSMPICMEIRGSGPLQRWSASANAGLGGWIASTYGTVNFVFTTYDGGTISVCRNKTCTKTDVTDWVGMALSSGSSITEPPVSSPVVMGAPNGKGQIYNR